MRFLALALVLVACASDPVPADVPVTQDVVDAPPGDAAVLDAAAVDAIDASRSDLGTLPDVVDAGAARDVTDAASSPTDVTDASSSSDVLVDVVQPEDVRVDCTGGNKHVCRTHSDCQTQCLAHPMGGLIWCCTLGGQCITSIRAVCPF